METIIRKRRVRIKRGRLQYFSELPFCVQTKFKIIANIIKKLNPEIQNIYVYGSYFWGWWDKDSDYDIRIHEGLEKDYTEFKKYLQNKYRLKVDVMPHLIPKKKMNLISIPL